jgi:putative colanic acid biosynthesis acetyltransferase WcaF
MVMSQIDLSRTSNRDYQPGRPFLVRALWLLVESVTLLNPVVTSYRFKAWILRIFGAEIGSNLVIKPNVHVKFPWHLSIGDNVWLGERSWIDNFVPVKLGSNVCVSQGAYLCTGNHDYKDPGMGLVVRPIEVRDGAWIGAFVRVAPGTIVGEDAVITLGSVLTADAQRLGVYAGNPAELVRQREIRTEDLR